MSWEDQGRQRLGWFGHGRASASAAAAEGAADALFAPDSFGTRIGAVSYAAVAHLPPRERNRDSTASDGERLNQLRDAMAAWTDARSLDTPAFRVRFLDPWVSDAAVGKLRAATEGARTAATHADLAMASADLAEAMQSIGFDNWPRFLRRVAARAGTAGRVAEPERTEADMPTSSGRIVLAQAASGTMTDAVPGSDRGVAPGRYVAENAVDRAASRRFRGMRGVGPGGNRCAADGGVAPRHVGTR